MATPSTLTLAARSDSLFWRAWRWYFTPVERIDDLLDVVAWWEARRVPYNILVGAFGVVSLALWLSIGSLPLMSEQANAPDAVGVEPLAVFAAPFMFNFAYTAGWICEIPFRVVGVRRAGPLFLKLGTGLSLLMVSVVGSYWVIALLVELVRVYLVP